MEAYLVFIPMLQKPVFSLHQRNDLNGTEMVSTWEMPQHHVSMALTPHGSSKTRRCVPTPWNRKSQGLCRRAFKLCPSLQLPLASTSHICFLLFFVTCHAHLWVQYLQFIWKGLLQLTANRQLAGFRPFIQEAKLHMKCRSINETCKLISAKNWGWGSCIIKFLNTSVKMIVTHN